MYCIHVQGKKVGVKVIKSLEKFENKIETMHEKGGQKWGPQLTHMYTTEKEEGGAFGSNLKKLPEKRAFVNIFGWVLFSELYSQLQQILIKTTISPLYFEWTALPKSMIEVYDEDVDWSEQ